jgi:hypothetical protein
MFSDLQATRECEMTRTQFHTGLTILAASATAAAGGIDPPPTPFEEASIIVEHNATDGDTEIVIEGVAGDEGLQLLRIRSPDGRRVVTLLAPDPTTLGMREFLFESPEPPGDAVLAAYPEGKYVLYGESTSGEVFRSVLTLSHDLPPPVTILHPAHEAELPAREALVIRWSHVPDIEGYLLEFENESEEIEQALTINLPAHQTSYRIPARLLPPGGEFQIGIHTVAENGNIVAVESTFTTEE